MKTLNNTKMQTITNLTDKQLTSKIQNLLKKDFTKCKILNSLTSETITLKCNWNGLEYNTNLYVEEISNPNYQYQICISNNISINSNMHFPYSEEGIKEAVQYIN
tara:strand:+ start:406 stop:720 length:315 start_codon:yes stop_codon:yes gene_type:complete